MWFSLFYLDAPFCPNALSFSISSERARFCFIRFPLTRRSVSEFFWEPVFFHVPLPTVKRSNDTLIYLFLIKISKLVNFFNRFSPNIYFGTDSARKIIISQHRRTFVLEGLTVDGFSVDFLLSLFSSTSAARRQWILRDDYERKSRRRFAVAEVNFSSTMEFRPGRVPLLPIRITNIFSNNSRPVAQLAMRLQEEIRAEKIFVGARRRVPSPGPAEHRHFVSFHIMPSSSPAPVHLVASIDGTARALGAKRLSLASSRTLSPTLSRLRNVRHFREKFYRSG